MKKITLLLLLFVSPFFGFAQTFDFTNTDDGWTELGGVTATNGATFMTLTTVDGDGTKKNPTLGITTAGVNTANVSFVGITLKNNNATGPDYLRVSYPKPASGRFYVNLDITTGDTGFVTYWFDLTHTTNWVGTIDDFKLHFKSAGNSDYILPNNPDNISIDIDKIEFVAALPTTLKETYAFDTDDDTEGFTATNGTITGPAGGILTFEPTPAKFAKLEQSLHHINADNSKIVRVTLKNNSAMNNQLRLVTVDGAKTQEISVSDTAEKMYGFDLSGDAGWTGDQTFTIGIGSTTDGKAADNGTVEINSIVFNNTVLSVERNGLADFSLYPNPVNDKLFFNGPTAISKIEIYNLTGQRLKNFSNFNSNSLDFSSLNNGVYLLNVIDIENNSTTKKIIVQK
ncbi:T9SS type A sorting domain-containing protein [Aureibaculum sp. 2210JD6-5]|uniref:T9SS type A sorting domain-containing protein n=1 Tax=Aureibaculum sp. 2210JD6-5 TaxID=3103957 RepID=UPI002AAD5B58|nr:T9SS type A sorting domain-containing protein [Aureibaculum sp. 2210JD6-5]MDY7396788.1 T9SS type A sorting domain-containing protein [Aureibaculum sp. 2210JD6-5]